MNQNTSQQYKSNSKTLGLELCLEMIGGKWKPIILFQISKGINRFNRLFVQIEPINRQMLSKQLKELEKAKILERTLFPEIPPRVEYTITPLGKSLLPIVHSMNRWGEKQKSGNIEAVSPKSQQLPLFE